MTTNLLSTPPTTDCFDCEGTGKASSFKHRNDPTNEGKNCEMCEGAGVLPATPEQVHEAWLEHLTAIDNALAQLPGKIAIFHYNTGTYSRGDRQVKIALDDNSLTTGGDLIHAWEEQAMSSIRAAAIAKIDAELSVERQYRLVAEGLA